ncbi:MAG: PIN domain-containing protein [Acidiferrobacteraceae bacterium]
MFLPDTHVISELRKARAGKANPMLPHAYKLSPLVASSCPQSSSRSWKAERRNPAQSAILRVWLDEHVLPSVADRILSIDMAVARRSAALYVPNPQPFRDALIAATAIVHGMTVVTRSLADFRATGVPLLNPWDASQ